MPIRREEALVIGGRREMRGGKTLDGKVWLELDGRHRIELTPHDAFDLAKKIFGAIGIELEYEYGGRRQ